MSFVRQLLSAIFLSAYVLIALAAAVLSFYWVGEAGFGQVLSWAAALAVLTILGTAYVLFPRR